MKTKNKQINMTTFGYGINAGTLSRLFTFQAIQTNWKLQNKKRFENLNEKYIKRGTHTLSYEFISNTRSTWHILYTHFFSDFSYGSVWDIPKILHDVHF